MDYQRQDAGDAAAALLAGLGNDLACDPAEQHKKHKTCWQPDHQVAARDLQLEKHEEIATPPNTDSVASQTRRYSSAPHPMMRAERECLMASAAIQTTARPTETIV